MVKSNPNWDRDEYLRKAKNFRHDDWLDRLLNMVFLVILFIIGMAAWAIAMSPWR